MGANGPARRLIGGKKISYGIGEGPAARAGLSLTEGTTAAIRKRVVTAAAVERELRGQILDDYLEDYEHRKGPIPEQEQVRARQIFDEVFAEEGK